MELKTNVVLLGLGILLHLTCLISIFDMYFRSPIVHGMATHDMPKAPPAKRLVLFVGDGVRAHSFFESDEGKPRAPYLHNILTSKGSWGISHTRVPTESRPCHVAIIAGFYEDVSAVTRGWKENPVEFDSVFNQSTHTWSWGSPDILPMFEKGAAKDRVSAYMYPPEVEDFGDEDASHLDLWVFDRVKSFLEPGRLTAEESNLVHRSGVVFFLHLLGTDTNGHAHRPSSWQYQRNIALVDEGIKNMTEHIENFFGHDGRTAYVFTSDHGMTDWGVHGSGLDHETLTPLVVWGAGVAGPQRVQQGAPFLDGKEWGLDGFRRKDVEQADIAPLMSALLGIAIPANNVGRLPVSYMGTEDRYTALSKLTNAKQILSQLDVMASQKRANTPEFLFVGYPDLSPSTRAGILRRIDQLLHQDKFSEAIAIMEDLIDKTLHGLRYYQTYDRLFIGAAVAMGMIGGIVCIVTEVLGTSYSTIKLQAVPGWFKLSVSLMFAAMATLLALHQSPLMFYIYGSLPLGCLVVLRQRLSVWQRASSELQGFRSVGRHLVFLVLLLAGLEILVWSFFWRPSLSLGLVVVSIWPWSTVRLRRYPWISLTWTLGCLVLAVFPTLPVVGGEPTVTLVNVAACVLLLCYPLAIGFLNRLQALERKEIAISAFQFCFFATAVYVVNATAERKKRGMSLTLPQTLSWILLVTAPLLPVLGTCRVGVRLVRISMAIATIYLLMTISYESLFLLTLSVVMFSWLGLEALSRHDADVCLIYVSKHEIDQAVATSLSPPPSRRLMPGQSLSVRVSERGAAPSNKSRTVALSWAEVRSAYFLVFFSTLAFFGTGNIASLNSFTVASVMTFLTMFSPFLMLALLVTKIVLPLLIVTTTFNAIRDVCSAPVREFFALSLVMSDVLALHFFFLVRDSGSWLDIGTSISHFALSIIMAGALLLLCTLSHILLAVRAQLGEDKAHED